MKKLKISFVEENKQEKIKRKYKKYPRIDKNLILSGNEEEIEAANVDYIRKIKARMLKSLLPAVIISVLLIAVLSCASIYIYKNQCKQIEQLSLTNSGMSNQIKEQKKQLEKSENTNNSNSNITQEQVIQALKYQSSDEYRNGHNRIVTNDNNNSSTVSNERLCEVPDCENSAKNGSYYCFKHECSVSGCHEQIVTDRSRCCLLHKCSIPDCNQQREADSYYCSSHECMYPTCHKKRKSGFCMYCAEHDN